MIEHRDAILRAIGNEIRAARARARVTQAVLAERSGLSHATINRLEQGKRTADALQLIAICDALGVAPSDLLRAAPSEVSR